MYCLTIVITEDQREIADAIGYGHDTGGCVEEQSGDQIKLTFYFEREDNAESAESSFAKLLSVDPPIIEYVADNQDWNAKWRESMEPAEIAAGVWVSPAWLEPPAEGRAAWIKIEPKMAFGTGHHETTRLAARELIARRKNIAGKAVLDIGTGSGVLCFVADYVGAKLAAGVEIDGDCLENLAENLNDNPPKGCIDFMIGTLDAINAKQKFDVVIMNMLLTESSPLLEQIKTIIHDNSLLIWSGILAAEKNEVIDIAGKFGFKLSADQTENEWWCGTFVC
jgi:ribosomal protein L11 methyltransferase